ncbi:hypothetical protein DPMN_029869 [Dreissena polymorpha]|uniref:Uncharacterized protein n=1 Tax=Dreissena polymorpha TaxID=45954 RepID=A0A9D4LYZ0_DREPO|nr:hypothetical protein DPMN_029869 [Dreissena polymorpha]
MARPPGRHGPTPWYTWSDPLLDIVRPPGRHGPTPLVDIARPPGRHGPTPW